MSSELSHFAAVSGAAYASPVGEPAPCRGVPEAVEGPQVDKPRSNVPLESSKARLEAMLHREFAVVWRAVRRFGVPEDSADDAAQEVFIIAARRLHEIEVGRERKFLYGVALRVAGNARRSRKARREHPDEAVLLEAPSQVPSAEMLLDEKRMRLMLDCVLDRMSDDLRTTFVLHELEGFSSPEISELCGIPLGTVASRLRRAREAFQDAAARVKATIYGPGGTP